MEMKRCDGCRGAYTLAEAMAAADNRRRQFGHPQAVYREPDDSGMDFAIVRDNAESEAFFGGVMPEYIAD